METTEKKKNPFLIALVSLLPEAIKTVTSIIKDKKERKAEDAVLKETTATTGEAIVESIKEAVSTNISSKRLLNIAGSGLIITMAITNIGVHGLTKLNLGLICIGVVYSLGMSLITYLSDRVK